MRIETVVVEGQQYERAEEGSETMRCVKKLNQIGDFAHEKDEMVPTSSRLVQFIARIIESRSLVGKILRTRWLTTDYGIFVKIKTRNQMLKKWQQYDDEIQENLDDNASYIAYLQITRGGR